VLVNKFGLPRTSLLTCEVHCSCPPG
jgi:hypothetical protein